MSHWLFRSIYNRAKKAGIVDPIHYPFGHGKLTLKRPESLKIGSEEGYRIAIQNNQFYTSFVVPMLRQVYKIKKSVMNFHHNSLIISVPRAGLPDVPLHSSRDHASRPFRLSNYKKDPTSDFL